MSIVLFSPFGQRNPEVGLQYLLGRYLTTVSHSVNQLICNGVFAVCDRDAEINWNRSVDACFSCMQEQRDYGRWSGIPIQRLSDSLTPDEVQGSFRWVNSLDDEALMVAKYEGSPIEPLIRGTFASRFGIPALDPKNKIHNRFYRVLVLSAARLALSMERYLNTENPELLIVVGGESFIAQTVKHVVTRCGTPTIELRANVTKRCVELRKGDEVHECPLLIEDVLTLRTEVKSWSPELVRLLKLAEEFLPITVPPAAAVAGL